MLSTADGARSLFPFDILHQLAIELVVRYSLDGHWWLRFVVHAVVMYGPAALALLVLAAMLRRLAPALRRGARPDGDGPGPAVLAGSSLVPGLFRYVLLRTGRQQIGLVAVAAASMPVLYATLELPKTIINKALESQTFPIAYAGFRFEQVEHLFVLCLLFLAAVICHGAIKYAANLSQGRLGERTLRRLRLGVFGEWRRRGRPGGSAQLIPLIVQELEPIGGFAGAAFVVPVLQGGTFVTILTFMLVQDAVRT
jgi:hypothetical protein